MFFSSLPKSYKPTTQQYLDNIMSIANYKIQDIIAWVLWEESGRKAQAIRSGLSLNKFSTAKNLGQNVQNVQKLTTALKITGQGESVWTQAREIIPKSVKFLGEQKDKQKKGKGQRERKGKAPESTNVLDTVDLLDLSITSSKPINFSCYEMNHKVEWFLK